jgi:hypothetical protein
MTDHHAPDPSAAAPNTLKADIRWADRLEYIHVVAETDEHFDTAALNIWPGYAAWQITPQLLTRLREAWAEVRDAEAAIQAYLADTGQEAPSWSAGP